MTIINEIIIYLVYNATVENYIISLTNQRLIGTLCLICKTKQITIEMLIKKYNDIVIILEDCLYSMDSKLRLNLKKNEEIFMKDIIMHSLAMYKVKSVKENMMKIFYYHLCNKDYNDKKLNIINEKKLRSKLLYDNIYMDNTKYCIDRVDKVKDKFKINDPMKRFILERNKERHNRYQFITFDIKSCNKNFDFRFSYDKEDYTVQSIDNYNNHTNINTDLSKTRSYSVENSLVNDPVGLDFDLLAQSLKKSKNNVTLTKPLEIAKFNSSGTNLHNTNGFINNDILLNTIVDFTKSYSHNQNYNQTYNQSNYKLNLNISENLETNTFAKSTNNSPRMKRSSNGTSTNIQNDIWFNQSYTQRNNFNYNIENYNNDHNIIYQNENKENNNIYYLDTHSNINIKRISNEEERLKYSTSYLPNSFQEFDNKIRKSNTINLRSDENDFNTINSKDNNINPYSSILSSLDFSEFYKPVLESKREDKFDRFNIRNQLRGLITEKGYIKCVKGDFQSIQYKGQIALELANNFEIKNKIISMKINHEKWNDKNFFQKEICHKENVQAMSDKTLRVLCTGVKDFFRVVQYKIYLKLIDSMIDFKFKKEFSKLENKLKSELYFSVGKRYLEKLKNFQIVIEINFQKGVKYEIYKSSIKNYTTSPGKLKYNINNISVKNNFGVGVIFQTEEENLVESIRLSYLFMVSIIIR